MSYEEEIRESMESAIGSMSDRHTSMDGLSELIRLLCGLDEQGRLDPDKATAARKAAYRWLLVYGYIVPPTIAPRDYRNGWDGRMMPGEAKTIYLEPLQDDPKDLQPGG
jgi:hypothetical protein